MVVCYLVVLCIFEFTIAIDMPTTYNIAQGLRTLLAVNFKKVSL